MANIRLTHRAVFTVDGGVYDIQDFTSEQFARVRLAHLEKLYPKGRVSVEITEIKPYSLRV
jgi:hypothetical protein